jgi:hypothetical protein
MLSSAETGRGFASAAKLRTPSTQNTCDKPVIRSVRGTANLTAHTQRLYDANRG